MKQTKRCALILGLFAVFCSLNALAYPLWVRIENTRAHSVFVFSPSENLTLEIPHGEFREFMVDCASDWVVRYSSGAYGLNKWNLEAKLDTFIGTCQRHVGDNAKEPTLKYAVLHVEELEPNFGLPSRYALKVAEIRDLKIKCDSEVCKMNAFEKALKVVAVSKSRLLLTDVLKAASILLYKP